MPFIDPQTSSNNRGIMMLAPQYRGTYDLYRVTQNGCQVRFYPCLDEQGNAQPIRFGRELHQVGNWVNAEHFGINYLGGEEPGKEKVALLLSVKGDSRISEPNQRRGLRVWNQLCNTLYHRLNAGTAPSHWSRWAVNAKTAVLGPASRSRAKPVAFTRGMITHYCNERGPVRGISPQSPKVKCILQLGSAAQRALIDLVMMVRQGAENYHGEDWNTMFRYNSLIVDPQTGCLINFGKVGQTNPAARQNFQAATAVSFAASAGQTSGAQGDEYKVEAFLDENSPVAIPATILQAAWQHSWDQILNVYDNEAELIKALELGFPDELLIAAFGDQPELLSERLRTKMAQAAQGFTPPNYPVYGGYPSTPQPAPFAGGVPGQFPPAQFNSPFGPVTPAAPPAVPQSPVNFPTPATMAPSVPASPVVFPTDTAPAMTAAANNAPPFEADPPAAGPTAAAPVGLADMEAALRRAQEAAKNKK